ncbi:hypothetical protein Pmar_PMAR007412 [Perkinsus marinus ATCC 50983]|uniref:Uncharacterized protein n=1 Tax=Perkinsus marinus (strain ATCC 50983 / TXsc) TaxID=423536 RepID=C5KZI7_PERM5|nr:hypothetical protein Pmar_PMAR007412 [Perkinsus marinus ATCC 50983]EER10106.1 hypothetical protein Pmar_PMAR007412 [Perkinsus marinus ATCC 50983]|eukprot:XP_002778311.1 hypothetical protein Pmar_PMAR007412 [Perkinsus marinus ATCC 50983]
MIKLIGEVIPEHWSVNWSLKNNPPLAAAAAAPEETRHADGEDDDDLLSIDPSEERGESD